VNRKTIGIIGYGFVGEAVFQLNESYHVEVYDPYVIGFETNLSAFQQDIVFVCVPTPVDSFGTYDLTIVEESAEKWSKLRKKDSILVIKSTISPGTIDKLCERHCTNRIVHNPEFLTQRTAMQDFRKPVEVIVGGDPACCQEVVEMYQGYYPFGHEEPRYVRTSSRIAELVKVTRNSYYAVKVSFFNEVHELANALDISYPEFRQVFTLGGNHPWVESQHTSVPGPDGQFGFGGACLPKDSMNLANLADDNGVDMSVLKTAIETNKKRRKK
jgi:UDPglucose 6-dehydrogenase